MGQFSVKIYGPPGSILNATQHQMLSEFFVADMTRARILAFLKSKGITN